MMSSDAYQGTDLPEHIRAACEDVEETIEFLEMVQSWHDMSIPDSDLHRTQLAGIFVEELSRVRDRIEKARTALKGLESLGRLAPIKRDEEGEPVNYQESTAELRRVLERRLGETT